MSTVRVDMFRVVCDYPDCGACAQDEGDYYAWSDAGQADDDAQSADWLSLDGDRHYCAEHTIWDEDKDEQVPLPVPAGQP